MVTRKKSAEKKQMDKWAFGESGTLLPMLIKKKEPYDFLMERDEKYGNARI